jgi:hypothetical protein
VKCVQRAVTAEPGLLKAAEGHGYIAGIPAVHPNQACPDLARGSMRQSDVPRPKARGKSIDRIIGETERFDPLLCPATLALIPAFKALDRDAAFDASVGAFIDGVSCRRGDTS